jgi:hypothetical protein
VASEELPYLEESFSVRPVLRILPLSPMTMRIHCFLRKRRRRIKRGVVTDEWDGMNLSVGDIINSDFIL